MKRHLKFSSKILILGLVSALMMTSLTGCLHRKKTAYQDYMKNILDVNYKGDFDGYVKDNDGTEEDASVMYSDTIDYLADQLINHYSLNNAESDDVNAIFDETAKVIYSKSKYEVSKAYKNGDDYYVDVTVYPMNILNQAFDDVFSYIDEYNKKISAGDFNNTAKEDYEKEFAQGIADILQEKSANMDYLNPIVVSVKIVDDGDYYSADAAGISQIDASMLAIEGSSGSSSSDSNSDSDSGSDEDGSDNSGESDITAGEDDSNESDSE